MDIIIIVVIALVGLILGAVIAFLFLKMLNKGKADAIVKEAEAEAEVNAVHSPAVETPLV